MEEHAAHFLNGLGRAHHADRNVHRPLLAHVDDEEVDVERVASDGMLLDALHEHGLWPSAIQREIYERVAAGRTAEQLELMGIELDQLRLAALTVHDGGQHSVPTQPLHGATGDVAGLR
jgi:hypothetical protein